MQWLMVLWLFTACSGYRYAQQDNPLSQYGIQTLSVPMFYNYSNQPELSPEFTRETYRILTGFSGLRLHSGYKESTDAVLIGIIHSPKKMNESLVPFSRIVAQSRAGNAIGNDRQNFYIPGTSSVALALQIIVIKKPTDEELALLRSGIGGEIKTNSKIIFNDTLPLGSSFQREVMDNEGNQVIATQNAGSKRKTTRVMAEAAAISVRDMILYAF